MYLPGRSRIAALHAATETAKLDDDEARGFHFHYPIKNESRTNTLGQQKEQGENAFPSGLHA